jgi:hypothetical protein
MGIPSGYLGGTVGEQGATYDPKSYLSNQEIQFARTIERIQKFIVQGLEKIAYIELALQRVDPRKAKDFKIKLTPPSNVDQLMDIEVFNQKFSLIANIKANQFFLPDDWIYKQVLGFSDKDIQKIRLQMQMEAQTSLAAQQGAGGGAGGGGGGGGGDMGGGFSGGNIAGPEAGAEAGGPAGGAGGEPAAPGAAPAPGGAAPAGGAEPGLEVASNNVEFDGHKFLIENTRDIKKMLTYMQLYEQVHMDDKPIDYSQHNSVTKMMTEGQFKGLFKQRDGESILVEKKVRKKK